MTSRSASQKSHSRNHGTSIFVISDEEVEDNSKQIPSSTLNVQNPSFTGLRDVIMSKTFTLDVAPRSNQCLSRSACSHRNAIDVLSVTGASNDPKKTHLYDLTTDDRDGNSTPPPSSQINSQPSCSSVPESISGGGGGHPISVKQAPAANNEPEQMVTLEDLMEGSGIASLKQRQKHSRNIVSQCSHSGVPESIIGGGGDTISLNRAPITNKELQEKLTHHEQKTDFQAFKDPIKGSGITSRNRRQKQSRNKGPSCHDSQRLNTHIYDLTTDELDVNSAQPPSRKIISQCSRLSIPESISGMLASPHPITNRYSLESYLSRHSSINGTVSGGGGDPISLNQAPAANKDLEQMITHDDQKTDSLDFQALKDLMGGSDIAPLKQSRSKGPICCNSWCSSRAEIIPSQNIQDFFGIPGGKTYRICQLCRDLYAVSSEARVTNFENGGDILEMMYSHRNEFVVLEDENASDDDDTPSQNDEYSDLGEELIRNAIAESVLEFESITNAAINRSKEQVLLNMENFVHSGKLLVNQIQQINLDMYKSFSEFQNQFRGKVKVLPELDIPLPKSGRYILKGVKNSGSLIRSADRHSSKLTVKAPKASDSVFCILTPQSLEWCVSKVESVEMNCVDDNKIVETFTLTTTVNGAIVQKVVGSDEIAFFDPPCFQIGVGRRVVAAYRSSVDCPERFLSGMISETPSETNQFRYLVFFEVGHVQYCSHSDVRLVYKINKPVYEYFIGGQSTLVMQYLCNYPKTKMYLVEVGQHIRVEKNGFWVYCCVERVDASLVLLKFLFSNESEWLYRGSPRLRPVFDSTKRNEVQDVDKSQRLPTKKLDLSKTNNSSVGYKLIDISNDDDEEDVSPLQGESGLLIQEQTVSATKNQRTRGAAKKDVNVLTKVPPNVSLPRPFRVHRCSFACVISVRYDVDKLKGVGLLAIPSIFGFARKIEAKQVKYLSPCGVILSNIRGVWEYLSLTFIPLTPDMFTFSLSINIFDEWIAHPQHVVMDDISFGVENCPIPCINDIDSDVPCLMSYITERRPQDGVFIDQDPGFLVSCDCEDNCANRSVCSCWKLNYESFSLLNLEGIPLTEIGYKYQRLKDPIPSGIYECNRNCKCAATCLNRVVQHPLKNKLQLFKTPKTGWGIRCMNDIPHGTFVCTYVAAVYTEEASNEIGRVGGDEYFAELDHIEVMEYHKIGYETDVDSDASSSVKGLSVCKKKKTSASKKTRGRNRKTYEPGTLRKLYGPNEYPYVLDAKQAGNIGRFLNHSCSPNLFVQNVFVDSHDLRFPWIAYFASQDIPAGSELTWNYGYCINSVPGKVLFCQCGSPNCVIRLL